MESNQQIQLNQSLLNELSKFNLTAKIKPQTFMQVSGYPHFENVCSNILAFLFSSDESHGFSDLFIKSLLEAANTSIPMPQENILVEREVLTKTNKRIDLVLSNDSIVVGIENKIFSSVYNDLEDYKNTIIEIALERKNKHY